MPNLKLEQRKDISVFRKIAIGNWRASRDPTIHGALDVRMEAALEYIEKYRAATGQRLTVTHLTARAVAEALRRMPDANAIIRMNRLYRRKNIGIFLQVAMTDQGEDKIDLSGVTIHDIAEKSMAQIVEETNRMVEIVRQRKSESFRASRNVFTRLPSFLLKPAVDLLIFFCYTLNLDLTRLGFPRDGFGSAMVTNIGSLGLDEGYPPLAPISGCPIVVAVGAVRDAVVAEDGKPAVRKMMKLCATFDHRIVDGSHAAIMSKTVREWMENPFGHFDAIP